MTWRLAKSLETLRSQVNKASPNRSKASDGTIGDAAHASRSSDHNPHVRDGSMGVVTALDITHDPAHGVDIQKLADALVASRDSRIKYIICNGNIVSGSGQSKPAWKWRPYSGSNKHTKHVHFSVKGTKALYDSTKPWRFDGSDISEVTPSDSIMKRGAKGPFVKELQINLIKLGHGPLEDDGVFGEKTERAVKAFQRNAGLTPDGWAGPRTIDAIGAAVADKASKPKIKAAQKSVPETADDEVKESTNWLQGIIGFFTGGGGLGTMLYGVEWQVVVTILAVGLVAAIIIYLFRRRLIAAFREINAGVRR